MSGRVRHGLGKPVRPGPERIGKERAHRVGRAVERRAACLARLHQEHEKPPLGSQPVTQPARIVVHDAGRQGAEAGLVVDCIEWRRRRPFQQIGPHDDAPCGASRSCWNATALGARIHHRHREARLGQRRGLGAAPGARHQNAAGRERTVSRQARKAGCSPPRSQGVVWPWKRASQSVAWVGACMGVLMARAPRK